MRFNNNNQNIDDENDDGDDECHSHEFIETDNML